MRKWSASPCFKYGSGKSELGMLNLGGFDILSDHSNYIVIIVVVSIVCERRLRSCREWIWILEVI